MPIFFGPDLQLGLSAEIWHHGPRPDLPARPSGQILVGSLDILKFQISRFTKIDKIFDHFPKKIFSEKFSGQTFSATFFFRKKNILQEFPYAAI